MKKWFPLFFLIAACATSPAPPPTPPAAPEPPQQAAPQPIVEAPAPKSSSAVPGAEAFAALEAQLLEQSPLILRFHIVSQGAMVALAKGDLIRLYNSFSLHAYGKLADEKKEGDLKLDPAPEATRRTVILGMTRMGLLHNIYRLYNQQEVEADIDQKVEAANVTWDAVARKFAFDVMFNGRKAGEAELWVNEANQPVQRHQVVHFPNGDMTVRESYVWPH